MAAATGASEFLNRNSEREHLDALLADVRAGHSAALLEICSRHELASALPSSESELAPA